MMDYKILVGGVEYGKSGVRSVSIESPLFEKFGAGNACAAVLEMSFRPTASVPWMAEIIPYVQGDETKKKVFMDMYTTESVSGRTWSIDVPTYGKYAITIPEVGGQWDSRVQITVCGTDEATGTYAANVFWDIPPLHDPVDVEIVYAPDNTFENLLDHVYWQDLEAEDIESTYTDGPLVTIEDIPAGDWQQLGVFWLDERSTSSNGVMSIVAYDAMCKSDVEWIPDQETLTFPMSMPDAVAEIARLMDVEVDSRTELIDNEAYLVDYPANGYTLRDVLRFIAAAHCGNWIITTEGKLLLVPLFGGMPEETNYLVDQNGNAITFGGVRILV